MAKKSSLKMSPLMTLSILAIFAMMVPLFTLANNNRQAEKSFAASQEMMRTQPSPTPTPYKMK